MDDSSSLQNNADNQENSSYSIRESIIRMILPAILAVTVASCSGEDNKGWTLATATPGGPEVTGRTVSLSSLERESPATSGRNIAPARVEYEFPSSLDPDLTHVNALQSTVFMHVLATSFFNFVCEDPDSYVISELNINIKPRMEGSSDITSTSTTDFNPTENLIRLTINANLEAILRSADLQGALNSAITQEMFNSGLRFSKINAENGCYTLDLDDFAQVLVNMNKQDLSNLISIDSMYTFLGSTFHNVIDAVMRGMQYPDYKEWMGSGAEDMIITQEYYEYIKDNISKVITLPKDLRIIRGFQVGQPRSVDSGRTGINVNAVIMAIAAGALITTGSFMFIKGKSRAKANENGKPFDSQLMEDLLGQYSALTVDFDNLGIHEIGQLFEVRSGLNRRQYRSKLPEGSEELVEVLSLNGQQLTEDTPMVIHTRSLFEERYGDISKLDGQQRLDYLNDRRSLPEGLAIFVPDLPKRTEEVSRVDTTFSFEITGEGRMLQGEGGIKDLLGSIKSLVQHNSDKGRHVVDSSRRELSALLKTVHELPDFNDFIQSTSSQSRRIGKPSEDEDGGYSFLYTLESGGIPVGQTLIVSRTPDGKIEVSVKNSSNLEQ